MFQDFVPSPKTAPGPATVYFLDWLNGRVLTKETKIRSAKLFARLAAAASPITRLQTTPQTPPYHAEGDFVADHVKRILCGLDALEHGESLAEVEELAREKDYLLEFYDLEQTLKTQSAWLVAYAVCHDLAKAESLWFEAAPGSKGEAEGFVSKGPHVASAPEQARYDKLRRAHEASESSVSFYHEYQIVVHYPDHARRAASDEYASTREAVLTELGVPLSKAKLLTELIRCHMEVILSFKQGPDPVKYRALAAVAERIGLNVAVFLDLLPACLFLDAVLGSLVYEDGVPKADLHLLINVFKSEREAMPARHAAREQALKRGRKAALNEALVLAKIDADSVFKLLNTPYGPVRGEVMTRVHNLIRDPNSQADFGEQTAELRQRARVAHKLVNEQQLTIE